MLKHLCLAVGASVVLLGCSSSAPNSTAGTQSLVWAWPFAPTTRWAMESDAASILTQAGVAEPLTKIGFDGKLGPNLATSWQAVDDLTWDFTLRDGVKFQDGSAFDATAAANALNHVLHATAPARALDPKNFASITAQGPKVVRVRTTAPNALVSFSLATSNAAILAPAAYQGAATNPERTGTGPFIMTAQSLPQYIDLKANPNYWGGAVHLQSAQMRFVPDAQTRAKMIQSGEAQLVDTLPVPSLPILRKDSSLKLVELPVQRTTSLYLNNSRKPFSDARVRQAIQSAIDVNAIANQVLEGAAIPASGPFPTNAPWAPPGAKPVALDVSRAKSLLADAGVDPKKLTVEVMTYSERSELPLVAVAIQGMLAQVGINATIRVALYASISADFLKGNFDMVVASRGSLFDVSDPLAFFQSDYSCTGSFNISHFCDRSVDAQLQKVQGVSDPTVRYVTYRQLATQLQSSAVDVFLYNEVEHSARSPKLQNFQLHPNQQYFLTPALAFG